MKIGCVSTARIPSNTANSIQVMKVCQGLIQLGHEVCLFVPADPDLETCEWNELADRYGLAVPFSIQWIRFPAAFSGPGAGRNLFAWQAVQMVKQTRGQLLYTWAAQAAAFGLWQRLPTLIELHDRPTGKLGPLWLRLFLRQAGKKRVVCITHALQKALQENYQGLSAFNTIIAPNGVDLERFNGLPEPAEARKRLNLPEAVTVACTGHLYTGRGGDLFLNLAARFPSASFVWVGGRPEDISIFQEKARSYPISFASAIPPGAASKGLTNVMFAGFIPNRQLPFYQAAADILLMPYARQIAGSSGGDSSDICSPMKLFEYLAAGRAILSTDLPVLHEILNDANALFAPPEDESAWASALGRLLTDEPLRRRLSSQARQDAQRYSWIERQRACLQGFL